MKTLIIPDIHTHWKKADELLRGPSFDHVVFLGDYFDEFGDTVKQNIETAQWLKNLLAHPRTTCLVGNHDYAYWKGVQCSGNTPEKRAAIRKVLSDTDFAKLGLLKEVDGWLLSHAGVDCRWMPGASLWSNVSPLWVRPSEFNPIFHKQIFGHTEFKEPWRQEVNGFEQVCLDTRRNHYAMIDNGELTIYGWK